MIGVGHWGKKHVEELRALGVDVLVADLDQMNLKICEEKYAAHPCGLDDMLSDHDLIGVTICTPIDTHYTIAKCTLRSGKHTLVEKPLATKVRQGHDLIRLAQERRLVLTVGHIYRFNNAIIKAKELLRESYFGDVRIIRLVWTNLEPIYADRDVISDLAPHPFDILEFLFNKNPTEISCIGSAFRQRDLSEAEFINCVVGRTLVNIELSWVTPWKQRTMTIVGSEACARIDCLSQKIEVVHENDVTPIEITPNNTIRAELQHFLACMRGGRARLPMVKAQ